MLWSDVVAISWSSCSSRLVYMWGVSALSRGGNVNTRDPLLMFHIEMAPTVIDSHTINNYDTNLCPLLLLWWRHQIILRWVKQHILLLPSNTHDPTHIHVLDFQHTSNTGKVLIISPVDHAHICTTLSRPLLIKASSCVTSSIVTGLTWLPNILTHLWTTINHLLLPVLACSWLGPILWWCNRLTHWIVLIGVGGTSVMRPHPLILSSCVCSTVVCSPILWSHCQ